jgi:hypothetical protein
MRRCDTMTGRGRGLSAKGAKMCSNMGKERKDRKSPFKVKQPRKNSHLTPAQQAEHELRIAAERERVQKALLDKLTDG